MFVISTVDKMLSFMHACFCGQCFIISYSQAFPSLMIYFKPFPCVIILKLPCLLFEWIAPPGILVISQI